MPKKSIEINPFDGGLNNYADARDVQENELAAATNIKTDQPGKIKIGNRIDSGTNRTGVSSISVGTSIFQYNSDYDASNGATHTEYQVMHNPSNDYLARRAVGDTNFSALSTLGPTTPVFSVVDGNLRISDTTFITDTRFIGVTDVDYFGSAEDNFLTNTVANIDPPTDGDITKDPADQTDVPPSQNENHLDWIVQQKSGSVDQWFNFDQSDNNNAALLDSGSSFVPAIFLQKPVTGDGFPIQNDTAYNSGSLSCVMSSDGSINAQSGEMLRVRGASSIQDYNRLLIRFASQKSYEEKSIFFDIYCPSATKNSFQTTALKIRIGNAIASSGTSGNQCFIYYIGSEQINADAWTTLEFKAGQHDEVEGEPNAAAIDRIMIGTEHQQKLDSLSNDGVYYLENLTLGESSRGLWNGRYKFYQSYVYDKTQESNTFLLNGQSSPYEVENKILQFRVHAKRGSGAAMGTSRRVTGANIYYVEFDIDGNPLDTDKKLLMHVDMERGIKKVAGESWEAWGDAKGTGTGYEAPRNGTNTSFLQIMDPPVLETFSTNAGYNEDDKLQKMKYRAITMMNRRSYVGNVKIHDESGKTIRYSDRVYKSEPNMPDVFTEHGYVDVAINDGESITALAHFGDMLLQFKERTMYLINCTQEIEYLEDTSKFRGVWGQAAVCETDSGIVWVNDYGLFMFDGREILPLIDNKIDPDNWNDIIGSKPMVEFVPLDRSVLVVGDADNPSNGFTYSLRSKGFNFINGATELKMTATGNSGQKNITVADTTHLTVGASVTGTGIASSSTVESITNATTFVLNNNTTGELSDTEITISKNLFLNDMSNMVVSNDGTVSWYELGPSSNVTEYKWQTSSGDVYIDIKTRDQDFKDPARRKMVKNVYITYKVPTNGTVPVIKYCTNGSSTAYSFSTGFSKTDSAGEWTTASFKPNTASEASNVYSFQVHVYGNANKDFQINDINVVYRDKVLK